MIEENVTQPSFRSVHSRGLRVWHWSSFIIIAGSLITVLLAKTIFNVRDNISIIQENLQRSGLAVTVDQAKTIGKIYSHRIWDWHTYFGYVLAGLFLFRVLLEFFLVPDRKFLTIIKNARKYIHQLNGNKKETQYYLFVRYLYLVFYLLLGTMAFTGVFMALSDDVESLREARHAMKEVHSVGLYIFLSFIVLHLGGVLRAEASKKNKGIVSDMINGGE